MKHILDFGAEYSKARQCRDALMAKGVTDVEMFPLYPAEAESETYWRVVWFEQKGMES